MGVINTISGNINATNPLKIQKQGDIHCLGWWYYIPAKAPPKDHSAYDFGVKWSEDRVCARQGQSYDVESKTVKDILSELAFVWRTYQDMWSSLQNGGYGQCLIFIFEAWIEPTWKSSKGSKRSALGSRDE